MSELAELNRIGAVPQPNSGRSKINKGDGILDGTWVVDVKEYTKSFGLSMNVWAKICTDAIKSNMSPLLLICLGDEDKQKIRLIVQESSEWQEMKEKARLYDEIQEQASRD
jgi:hypothetical protein